MASEPLAQLTLENPLVASVRLPADGTKLRALLARALNVEQGTAPFSVAEDFVTLYAFAENSGYPELRPKPYAVFLVVRVRREGGGELLYCPYVFVSDFSSLTDLREQLGYPAWWANIEATWSADGLTVTVATPVYLADRSDPVQEALIEVVCTSLASEPPKVKQDPVHTVQLMQIREAARPDTARLREPVTVSIEFDQKSFARRDAKAVQGAVRIKGGFRNVDLIADLGLKEAYDLAECECEAYQAALATFTLTPQGKKARAVQGPLPKFVEPRVDPRAPPPYAFDDVRVKGFKFTSDRKRLNLLLDALLNAKGGEPRQNFQYRTATAEVVIEYLVYGKMRSIASETQWRRSDDYSQQNELVVRLLVGKTEEDSATATEPSVFCPFLFVDNWASMVSGREVMGLWKRMASFEVKERTKPEDPFECAVYPVAGSPPVLTVDHPSQYASGSNLRSLQELRGSEVRGVLPWVQRDFSDSPEFRRNFARDWLKISGEEFQTVQRTYLPRPEGPYYRQWVEATYRIRSFAILQPTGSAKLTFGSFYDKELAELLTDQTGLGKDAGVDAKTGVIDVARLLGLGDSTKITVTAGNWYEATGSFDARVQDPYK